MVFRAAVVVWLGAAALAGVACAFALSLHRGESAASAVAIAAVLWIPRGLLSLAVAMGAMGVGLLDPKLRRQRWGTLIGCAALPFAICGALAFSGSEEAFRATGGTVAYFTPRADPASLVSLAGTTRFGTAGLTANVQEVSGVILGNLELTSIEPGCVVALPPWRHLQVTVENVSGYEHALAFRYLAVPLVQVTRKGDQRVWNPVPLTPIAIGTFGARHVKEGDAVYLVPSDSFPVGVGVTQAVGDRPSVREEIAQGAWVAVARGHQAAATMTNTGDRTLALVVHFEAEAPGLPQCPKFPLTRAKLEADTGYRDRFWKAVDEVASGRIDSEAAPDPTWPDDEWREVKAVGQYLALMKRAPLRVRIGATVLDLNLVPGLLLWTSVLGGGLALLAVACRGWVAALLLALEARVCRS